jgi:Chaperone of endosialidase
VPSDIQLKHDVVRVGTGADGIALYRFQYNWSDQVYVGVIAQEVQAARPDAVVRGADGYLRVDYGRIGVSFQTWEQWLLSGGQPTGN